MAEIKTTDEINAQRDAGWPDFHPEDFCHRCGRPYGNWFIDLGEPEWYAITGGIGIVCPSCFMALDGDGLIYELRRWSPNLKDGASDTHLLLPEIMLRAVEMLRDTEPVENAAAQAADLLEAAVLKVALATEDRGQTDGWGDTDGDRNEGDER